jgi:hypothetical protein
MDFRMTKRRLAAAGLFVLAGVGLTHIVSPLVGTAAATAGQIVNVSDPVNANTAKVDSAGRLEVGDGAGALSVDGTVSTRPAAPASPWRAATNITAPSPGVAIAGPSSAPINLTSLSLSTDAPSGSGVEVTLIGMHVPSGATTCNAPLFDTPLWGIRDLGDGVTPLSFSFPTPLQWKPPANTKACLFAFTTTASSTLLNAVGFYGG